MGIYIKGVDKPAHCIDCPFMVSRENDDCILQSDKENEDARNWDDLKQGCPIIEIPDIIMENMEERCNKDVYYQK